MEMTVIKSSAKRDSLLFFFVFNRDKAGMKGYFIRGKTALTSG
jgi:hypothetical protein